MKNFKVTNENFNNCVYVYYKRQKTVNSQPKSIARDIAYKIDLYDFRDKTGNHSNFIDEQIYKNRIEASLSKLLFNFDNKMESGLTYFEEVILNNCIAYQITRTSYFRNCIESYICYLLHNHLITFDDLNLSLLVKKVLNNQFGLSSKELISYQTMVKPRLTEDPKAKRFITSFCLEMSDVIAKSIWGKSALLIKTPPGEVLVSDNPIIIFDFDEGVKKFIEWWDLKDKQILFPISHDRLLYITNGRPIYNIERDYGQSNSFVRLNNFGQFETATNEVYGKDKDILEKNKLRFNQLPQL